MKLDKTGLIAQLYDWLYATTSKFEEGMSEFGPDGLHLIGAIAKGRRCKWPDNRTLVRMLRDQYPESHPVWQSIILTEPACPLCESRLNQRGYCRKKDCPYHDRAKP